jgi:hypothetical protein
MNSRARFLRTLSPLAVLALVGCSLFDPRVGANQAACEAQSGSSTSGYGPAATDAAGWCGSDAGSACDECESRWCCQTRLGCYGDAVCDCADKALDTCLSATPEDAASSDPAVERCWAAFSASGDSAKSRLNCLRTSCQQVCRVPATQ